MNAAAKPCAFVSFDDAPWSDVWLSREHIMPRLARRRIARAEENTWDIRCERLLELIGSKLERAARTRHP